MNKTEIKKLKKEIAREGRLAFDHMSKSERRRCIDFCEPYKDFLDTSKTERKAAAGIVALARSHGFADLDDCMEKTGAPAAAGTRVYKLFKDKCVALAVIGKNAITRGTRIIASHIDSPRLDLKQNPLYEDLNLCLLKTHYYGGIRKYQWLALPLALHGTILKTGGERMDITIGEDENDPVFTVSDLLPHLAAKSQASKKLSDLFEAEKLNLICGSTPIGDPDTTDRFKLNILNILKEKYGLIEEDFISAEIEAVPAGRARDIGFDRSMIGAYGHDDRVCAYTSLKAVLDLNDAPEKTAVCLFFDKEEIGSEGSTGAKSAFIEDFFSDLIHLQAGDCDSRQLRKALIHSQCLSADVNAAIDPDFKEVHEKLNAAMIGNGVCITKFTGVAGKSGSNDASAEFVGAVRSIFNRNKVVWQTGELGKTDEGGGGTVAKFLAQTGMDVLDCGTALLSMHAPFEVAGKFDIYMTYKGYHAFLSDYK